MGPQVGRGFDDRSQLSHGLAIPARTAAAPRASTIAHPHQCDQGGGPGEYIVMPVSTESRSHQTPLRNTVTTAVYRQSGRSRIAGDRDAAGLPVIGQNSAKQRVPKARRVNRSMIGGLPLHPPPPPPGLSDGEPPGYLGRRCSLKRTGASTPHYNTSRPSWMCWPPGYLGRRRSPLANRGTLFPSQHAQAILGVLASRLSGTASFA